MSEVYQFDRFVLFSGSEHPSSRDRLARFSTRFSRQTPSYRAGNHGTEARSLSERRQVDGLPLPLGLVCNQEVRGSVPLRSMDLHFA
jgi:hypothetical protein